MSIEPITIPMSIEVNDVTIDSTIETNEVTIESTFDAKIEVGQGGDISVQSLTVTQNGTTTAPTGKAYSPVIVNVPASAVDTGTKNITSNGTHDVVGYASAAVSVPNTYTASDEGKVVDSGALVSQTSATFTSNGTYDTTTNDEVVVNVSGGTPTLITKTITENGTYSAEDDNADGYSEVTVNVSGGNISVDDLAKKLYPSGDIVFTLTDTIINQYSGFYNNPNITSIRADDLTARIDNNAFRYLSNLKEIDFPKVTQIGPAAFGSSDSYVFGGCPKLVKFNLPKLESLNGQYIFEGCGTSNNKATIALPSIINLSPRTFRNGYFHAVDLGPNLSTASTRGIRDQTFYNGYYDIVILRSSSVVPTTNADAIRRLTTDNGCTIYVPNALIASYQSATNWSSATRTYVAIEGSQYENYYADGTPIS